MRTGLGWLLAAALMAGAAAFAQEQPQTPPQTQSQPQNVPDAPSTTRPAQPSPFPPPGTLPPTAPPPEAPPPGDKTPPPPAQSTQVPAGKATQQAESERDQMFKIISNVSMVMVPVTVRDDSGVLVEGLSKKDFAVFENGVEQPIRYFTSDPFPLSVAVLLDLGLSDQVMRKINETLPNLAGAFSPFDEVAVYTYGNTVNQEQDFTAANERLSAALKRARHTGRTGGVPSYGGPMMSGPTINGLPVEPNVQHYPTPPRDSRVLNDAILRAALDMSKRSRQRRKVIFIISDGAEYGSRANYSDVLKVLLSNEISVYAVAVDAAAIPGWETLNKIRVPRMGSGNILPRYATASGGEVFAEFTKQAIEATYARVTEVARNQYTLAYMAPSSVANTYRSIDVHVRRPGLVVYARDGYYPLPAAR